MPDIEVQYVYRERWMVLKLQSWHTWFAVLRVSVIVSEEETRRLVGNTSSKLSLSFSPALTL